MLDFMFDNAYNLIVNSITHYHDRFIAPKKRFTISTTDLRNDFRKDIALK